MSANHIGVAAREPQEFQQGLQLAALQDLLGDDEIELICRQMGHICRHRELPPGVMVRSMVYRGLNHDKSIAAILADLAAAWQRPAVTDSAWCMARGQLPRRLLRELIDRRARELEQAVGEQYLYRGRSLYLGDGTTISMPDTPSLARAFGRSSGYHGRSRFPLARVTLLVRSGVQAICAYAVGRYRDSEDCLFHQFWDRLPAGGIIVLDVFYSSFYNLAKLSTRGVDVVTLLHASRDPHKLIQQGQCVGKGQWIVTLRLAPSQRAKYNDPTLPDSLPVRLIRVRKGRNKISDRWVVTTLLDPRTYPRGEMAGLYDQRWPIETRIGSLKTTLALNVARSKTPAGVRGEIDATILAHNLTWMLIHQAAQRRDVPAGRISFAKAVKQIVAFSPALRQAPETRRQVLYTLLLDQIAAGINRHRPGRVEPRKIKRDPVRYPYLRESRCKARAKCLT